MKMGTNNIFEKAKALYVENKLLEAERLCDDILIDSPQHEESLNLKGLIAVKTGRYEEAKISFNKVIRISPNNPVPWNNLGNTYKLLGSKGEAQNCYLKATTLEPHYVEALNNSATLYQGDGENSKAIELYIKVLKISPRHIAACYNLGMVFLKQGDMQKAKEQFKQVIMLKPDFINALYQLGNIYLLEDNLIEAKKMYQEILLIDTNHLDSLNNMGVVYIKNNMEQEALSYFSKILVIDDKNFDARNNMAAIFIKNHLYENAIMHYEELLKLDPTYLEGSFNLGVAYMVLGFLDKAIKQYKYILTQEPNHLDTLINLGSSYMKKGDQVQAIEHFSQALIIDPQNDLTRYMLSALQKEQLFDIAPQKYVQILFNNYALYYDQHVVNVLKYSLPLYVKELILTYIMPNSGMLDMVLDLGCGTGLCGQELRSYCDRLIGVDLSSDMLKVAEKKQVYDLLVGNDINEYLDTCDGVFNLITALEVFNYFGDLSRLFKLTYKRLVNFGYIIFSIELGENSKNYLLQANSRFSHAREYISELSIENGFSIITEQNITLRQEETGNIQGILYMLKKSN